ncbi:MAG TPA: protein-glutamate O-methyltransferase CheR [Treponemataceae bacterium]|nr:protein-glutamate O-methyltransferase CheR [Treponemataceae bacterium]
MTEDLVPLSDTEFNILTRMLFDRFGIHLGDQKRVLLSGRLSKRVRETGCGNFSEYIDYLRTDPTGREQTELINRITTNHSFFFREGEHFAYLKDNVFSRIEEAVSKRSPPAVRIWSAGCATGEEVYTIAMLMRSHFGNRIDGLDIGLLATDISVAALSQAKEGIYQESKLKELPGEWKRQWFTKAGPDQFRISDEIRGMVLFKKLNLMETPYPMKGTFDVIFCRNVMIYFNAQSREHVVNAMHKCLKPGGVFFVGHSESLNRETCPFEYVKPAIYKKGEGDRGIKP